MSQKHGYQSDTSDGENNFHTPPQTHLAKKSCGQPSASFDAVVVPAFVGKHLALLYRTICPQDLVYPFMYRRGNKNGTEVYVCSSCKQLKKEISALVFQNKFQDDPARLPHICQARFWPTEAAKRKLDNVKQDLRQSDKPTRPREVYCRP